MSPELEYSPVFPVDRLGRDARRRGGSAHSRCLLVVGEEPAARADQLPYSPPIPLRPPPGPRLWSHALTEHLLAPLRVWLVAVDPLEVAAALAVAHGGDTGARARSTELCSPVAGCPLLAGTSGPGRGRGGGRGRGLGASWADLGRVAVVPPEPKKPGLGDAAGRAGTLAALQEPLRDTQSP